MKQKIFKILIFLFLFLFVFYLGVVISYNLYYFFHKKEFTRLQEEWRDALTRPYMEDTFGGKTPQETWILFISALEKNDVELAKKYYRIDRQEKAKKDTEEIIKRDDSKELINRLFEIQLNAPEASEGFTSLFSSKNGFPTILITIQKNSINNLWKLSRIEIREDLKAPLY